MIFTHDEKLAIIKVLNEILLADGQVKNGELSYLTQLSDLIGFHPFMIQEAREMDVQNAIQILKQMNSEKKSLLAIMMHGMANADGYMDDEELQVIAAVLFAAGIDISSGQVKESKISIDDIYFVSSDHLRYENGIHVSGPHGGAKRAIKVEPNINGGEGYSVTVFNLDGNHPVWGSNVQVAPKPMKTVSSSPEKTVLRGFGYDPNAMGHPSGSFANYGLSIFHPKGEIEKIILHLHDRSVDLEYLR